MSTLENKGFIENLTASFEEYCTGKEMDAKEYAHCARMLFDSIALKAPGSDVDFEVIKAPNAVIEAIDKATGVMFRRYLELDFIETSNGIRLTGEDSSGEPSSIVYLSGTAIEKINELGGHGADHPHHRHDEHM